jgi:ferredoxin-NADP reductase/MOSC domain-containing protein YiiM
MARLLSVNVGLPRDIEWKGRTVHTGIWKDPVPGRVRVSKLNLAGDGQGDLAGHGGEQRAVFVYQIESYRHWQEQMKRTDFVHGQFGENFTVDGLPDDGVCIGDRYQIGSALFEVTQPRVTCYRVGIRMNEPRMPALLTSSGRPGFYFRVLQEGEVGAGDEIVKAGEAEERMTVAEINALLYSPNHPRERLERALRIEPLSPGWRTSFEALLQSDATGVGGGNAGLAPAAASHPAAPGFRRLTVTAIDDESADVLSLTMQSPDDPPLATALPGQYVVLRLQRPAAGPPLFRSYSLSGPGPTERYRISVKIEPNGAAGTYLREHVRVGDGLDVSSPRGSFVLQSGEGPVVLLSAGIGATPVLAMLHALAAARSRRRVWWLHAARDGEHHPFAAEVRRLMPALAHGQSYVCYSRPGSHDKIGETFDASGHLSRSVFEATGVPAEADVYLCGPTRFMADMKGLLAGLGMARERIHAEIFNGGESMTPGVAGGVTPAPHLPKDDRDTGPLVSFARSGIAAHWNASAYQSILELAEACDVPVRWSCRTGVCHNCESGLVSGEVVYGPEPLDKPANGNLLICCSQPVRDVVVDL